MTELIGPVHYRYRTCYDGQGITVLEERWRVIKETEAGYWINPEGIPLGNIPHVTKFVLKNSRRRYAYPDRQEAWSSFCIRRRKYERHLAWRAMCNAALVANLPADVPDREGVTGSEFCHYDSPKVYEAEVPDEQAAKHWNIPLDCLTQPPL